MLSFVSRAFPLDLSFLVGPSVSLNSLERCPAVASLLSSHAARLASAPPPFGLWVPLPTRLDDTANNNDDDDDMTNNDDNHDDDPKGLRVRVQARRHRVELSQVSGGQHVCAVRRLLPPLGPHGAPGKSPSPPPSLAPLFRAHTHLKCFLYQCLSRANLPRLPSKSPKTRCRFVNLWFVAARWALLSHKTDTLLRALSIEFSPSVQIRATPALKSVCL